MDLAVPPLLHAMAPEGATLGGLCVTLKRNQKRGQKYRYLIEQDGEGTSVQSCVGCPSLFSSLG